MQLDKNKLNLIIDNNTITNINEVIKYLESINDLTEDDYDYLRNLINHFSNHNNITNLDKLLDVINPKLIEYETLTNDLSNHDTLARLQTLNTSLNRINIINSPREKNDSNKELTYISITRLDGTVEVLECSNPKPFKDYIKDHAKDIVSKDADEIFDYFKYNIHQSLKFLDENSKEDEIKAMNDAAIINNPDIAASELEEVKNYASVHSPTGKIKFSVDHNGNRIFTIEDKMNPEMNGTIIKFYTEYDTRKKQILQRGDKELESNLIEEDNYQEMLTDLEEEVIEDNKIENNYIDIRDEIDINNIDADQLDELVMKKYSARQELTEEEQKYVNDSLRIILNNFDDLVSLDNDYSEKLLDILNYSVESMEEDYQAIIDDYENNFDLLTSSEYYLVNDYQEKKELLKKEEKVLKLEPKKNNQEEKKAGTANILLLSELALTGTLLIIYYILAIK